MKKLRNKERILAFYSITFLITSILLLTNNSITIGIITTIITLLITQEAMKTNRELVKHITNSQKQISE